MSRLQYRIAQHHAARRPRKPIIVAHAAPGDEQRLRLIPAIGRGMGGGVIPGTRPDHGKTGR